MGKVLSCYWKIHINGEELDETRRKCIESVDIQELCNGSDTCTLKVYDPNFIFIEDNIFIEESTVSVELGWHGDTHRVNFTGYISAVDIDFPDTGCPVLSIFCLDDTHLMNRKKKQRSWDNATNAEVVQKIAKEYGFKCVIEQGYNFTREDTISQSNATDIEFCESLAGSERVPFMCKLIGKTLYYVKMGLLKDPSSTLYYRKFPFDIVSFSPRINKETIKEEVTSSDIDTSNKKVQKSTASNKDTARDTQGEPVDTSTPKEKGMKYDPVTKTWKET